MVLAVDTLQAAFEELAGIKQGIQRIAGGHEGEVGDRLSEFQVLAFDYQEKIDDMQRREVDMKNRLDKSLMMQQELGEMVKAQREMLELHKQQHESASQLKQAQFARIISFDAMKEQQKTLLRQSLHDEVEYNR